MSPMEVSRLFLSRIGIFGQTYKSARFEDKEITIDDLTENYRVCICTPYNQRLDKNGKCKGAGEVIKELNFYTYEDSITYLIKNSVI